MLKYVVPTQGPPRKQRESRKELETPLFNDFCKFKNIYARLDPFSKPTMY